MLEVFQKISFVKRTTERFGLVLLAGCLWATAARAQEDLSIRNSPDAISDSGNLKQQVVDNRMSIHAGYARITITKAGMAPIVWKLWCSGKNDLRMEQIQDDRKIVSIQNEYDFFEGIPDRRMSPDRRDNTNPNNYIVDLRTLGILPVSTTALPSIPDLFNKFVLQKNDGAEISAVLDEGGASLKLITWKRGDYTSRIWIDETKGPSIIRTEAVNTVAGKIIRDLLVNRIAYTGGVWFPQHISYRRTVDGEGPPADEVEIDDVEINYDIDPTLFSLKSLNLAVGTYVNDNPSHPGGNRYWDGEKLVLEEPPAKVDHIPLAEPKPGKFSARSLLIWGNLALGIGCLVVWYLAKLK